MAIPNPNPNIADGIKSDNKTYSSNKIDDLVSTINTAISGKQDALSVTTSNATAEEGTTFDDNYIRKYGKSVQINITLKVASVTRWATIATIPEDYRPKNTLTILGCNAQTSNGVQFCSLQITNDGLIRFANALPDANISYSMATSYITD